MMKQNRKKIAARKWKNFQEEFELDRELVVRLRSMGYPLTTTRDELDKMDQSLTMTERIQLLCQAREEKVAKRKADIAAGLIEPKQRAKKEKLDPKWARAKEECKLSAEDIRKARELGLTPKGLIRNIPGPREGWKTPVHLWIRDLHERHQAKLKKEEV